MITYRTPREDNRVNKLIHRWIDRLHLYPFFEISSQAEKKALEETVLIAARKVISDSRHLKNNDKLGAIRFSWYPFPQSVAGSDRFHDLTSGKEDLHHR